MIYEGEATEHHSWERIFVQILPRTCPIDQSQHLTSMLRNTECDCMWCNGIIIAVYSKYSPRNCERKQWKHMHIRLNSHGVTDKQCKRVTKSVFRTICSILSHLFLFIFMGNCCISTNLSGFKATARTQPQCLKTSSVFVFHIRTSQVRQSQRQFGDVTSEQLHLKQSAAVFRISKCYFTLCKYS